MQTTSKVLVSDAVIYAASKAIPGLFGLGSVVVFVWLLSNDQYGSYSLLFAVANLAGTLASSWLSQSVLRFSGRVDHISSSLPRALRLGYFCSCAAAISIFSLVVYLLPLNLTIKFSDVLLVSALILALAAYAIKSAQLQSRLSAFRVLILEAVRSASALAFACFFIWILGPSHESVLLGVILSFVAAPLSVVAVRKPGADPRQRGDWSSTRTALEQMYRYGWPLSCWSGCVLLTGVADRYLIQHYLGISSTGTYAAVYDLIVRGFALYAFPITLAVHPRIMSAFNQGRAKEAMSIRNWAICIQVIAVVPVLTALWYFDEFLVTRVLGQDATAAVLVLPLALGGFLWQLALLLHKPLELEKATRLMLVAVGFAVAVSITVNVSLVPRVGILASAYAVAMSGALYCLIVTIAGRRYASFGRLPTGID